MLWLSPLNKKEMWSPLITCLNRSSIQILNSIFKEFTEWEVLLFSFTFIHSFSTYLSGAGCMADSNREQNLSNVWLCLISPISARSKISITTIHCCSCQIIQNVTIMWYSSNDIEEHGPFLVLNTRNETFLGLLEDKWILASLLLCHVSACTWPIPHWSIRLLRWTFRVFEYFPVFKQGFGRG